MDLTAEPLDDAMNSDSVVVDPLGSPREVNGQGEGWLMEDSIARQGNVGPEGAEGREVEVDLVIVRVSAQDESERKRVLEVTKPPSAVSVFHQNSIDHVNAARKFVEGL